MVRVRQIALVVGLGLLGSFITVMVVHYLRPFDPLDPEPTINYRVLFAIVFVVICGTLSIANIAGRRESSQ